jgi:ADP-sugar diphosphatase
MVTRTVELTFGGNATVSTSDAPSDQFVQFALESRIFKDWTSHLDHSFGVSEIHIQAVDFRGRPSAENVMFIRMRVKATTAPHMQIVELRGGTSGMFVILECDGVEYVVLVVQPRLPTGHMYLVELPAGMIDGGTFGGAAAKEIKEELDMTFAESEMFDLTFNAISIFLSPGLLDERMKIFLVRRHVTKAELDAMQGKLTGLRNEGETIKLKIVPLAELLKHTRDAKALAAFALYSSK